jgi:hypothetical protein
LEGELAARLHISRQAVNKRKKRLLKEHREINSIKLVAGPFTFIKTLILEITQAKNTAIKQSLQKPD